MWNWIIVDSSGELAEWVEVLKTVHKRKIQILAFANNHYAGYGPGTIEQFRELWRGQVGAEGGKRNREEKRGKPFKIYSCIYSGPQVVLLRLCHPGYLRVCTSTRLSRLTAHFGNFPSSALRTIRIVSI